MPRSDAAGVTLARGISRVRALRSRQVVTSLVLLRLRLASHRTLGRKALNRDTIEGDKACLSMRVEADAGYPLLRRIPSTDATACFDDIESMSPGRVGRRQEARACGCSRRKGPCWTATSGQRAKRLAFVFVRR